MRLPHSLLLCMLLMAPAGAGADEIGPDQAANLQKQLKDWFAGLLGPAIKLPDFSWTITGEHDHYRIAWPIPGLHGQGGVDKVTSSVRPLHDGRWSIDDLTWPPSGTFTTTIPARPDGTKGGPMKFTFSIDTQDTHGVIDPSLVTASTLHSELGKLAVTTDAPGQHQEQRFDSYVVDTKLGPVKDGRLDLSTEGMVKGWNTAAQLNNGKAVAFGMDTWHVTGQVGGVNRDRFTGLLKAIGNFIGALPADAFAGGAKSELPAPAKAQLRLVAAALQDVFTSVSVQEDLGGLKVEIAGIGGLAMEHLGFGMGGEAPDGKLHIWFNLAVDNLASPSIPPKFAAYGPHHFELRQSVSGVQTDDLRKLMLDASEQPGDSAALAPDLMQIFAHGGVDVGMETLAFDLGPAKLEASGKLTMLSPDTWRGQTHVVATGFDALTQKAHDDPDLQQGLPVLVMLRGLAKPDGEKLVWDIASDGHKTTVNGLDISQLTGGKPSGGQPDVAPPGHGGKHKR